jgi:uncharacterized membrane protein
LPARWETILARWQAAGLIDAAAAERVRAFESRQGDSQRLRWPTILAITIGGLMLGAGVLLFVGAHWDRLSPAERFSTVLLLVGVFHLAGAFVEERFPALATVLHGVGTASLGAGIFLAAQIFNLNEDWTGGVLLWAAGATVGFLLRRDWVQGTFMAILFPLWLAGKWTIIARPSASSERVLAEGLLLLAITYLTARVDGDAPPLRRALTWIGAVAFIPCVAFVLASNEFLWGRNYGLSAGKQILGWSVAIILPLLLAFLLRGTAAWMNAVACVWALILGTMHFSFLRVSTNSASVVGYIYHEIGPFLWCLVGAIGLIAWGLRESRKERINLGLAGIGLTILWFYFSNVMDKLGRSESLIGFGIVFLLVGWLLERARRKLAVRMAGRTQ